MLNVAEGAAVIIYDDVADEPVILTLVPEKDNVCCVPPVDAGRLAVFIVGVDTADKSLANTFVGNT